MSSNNIQPPRSRQSSRSPRSSQSSRSPRSRQSPQSPQSQRSQRSSNSLFGSDFSEEERRALDEAFLTIMREANRNQYNHDNKENKSPSPIRRVIQPKKTIKKKKTKNKKKISTLLHMRGGNKT